MDYKVWRRDSKIPHSIVFRMWIDPSGATTTVDVCQHCGLSAKTILDERLGCIAALQPKLPQPPKQKRRDGRFWKRR